jgi:hypothetical protein
MSEHRPSNASLKVGPPERTVTTCETLNSGHRTEAQQVGN